MSTLICGSLAYDSIMVFPDRFKNHILPEQIHILNVAFLVPEMRREYGGCAGNIAWNLKLLGGEPQVMAALGGLDGADYEQRLRTQGFDLRHVRRIEGAYTAQAFITTDLDDNQITAFHPGAMNHAHANRITETEGVTLAIIAPDGRQGMVEHARDLAAAKIPFIFDPGQGLPMFDGEALCHFLSLARWCAVNDYEAKLLVERTGKSLAQIAQGLDALIVTRGNEGSSIYTGGSVLEIPAAAAREVCDPTGCGDAYRAGLLHGISQGWPWAKTGQLAALMGAIKIEHRGGQNHQPTREAIAARYRATFGDALV